MGGIGSGPQKSPSALIKQAKLDDEKNLPQYFIKLRDLALSGDREALFYLIDRHLGKTKGNIDIEDVQELGAGMLLMIGQAIAKRRLDEYAIQEQGDRTEVLERQEEKAEDVQP